MWAWDLGYCLKGQCHEIFDPLGFGQNLYLCDHAKWFCKICQFHKYMYIFAKNSRVHIVVDYAYTVSTLSLTMRTRCRRCLWLRRLFVSIVVDYPNINSDCQRFSSFIFTFTIVLYCMYFRKLCLLCFMNIIYSISYCICLLIPASRDNLPKWLDNCYAFIY